MRHPRNRVLSFFLAASLTLPAAGGPALADNGQGAPSAENENSAAPQSQRALDDEGIASAVAAQVRADGAVALESLAISSDEGIVTLDGAVDNLLARERAVGLARSVRGVRGVVDLIHVELTESRSDLSLQRDVERALRLDPATDAWEVQAEIEERVAVLSGTVGSWGEKELAGRVARGVAGIVEVDNRITVTYATERPDDELRAEISAVLRWDTLVDDGLIEVAVDDGVATLRGVVGSAAEKEHARRAAFVSGVHEVDVEELQVQRWARDADLRRDKYAAKPDASVQQAIADALARHPRLSGATITARVSAGTAVLEGETDSLIAQRAAAGLARNVVGVRRVDNRIAVRAPVTRDDAAIEADVEQALALNPFLLRRGVEVDVDTNVVHLSGEVATAYEKRTAAELASSIRGVTMVRNDLEAATRPAISYDAYVDPAYGADLMPDFDRGRSRLAFEKSDPEMRRDIEDQLWWSPFVDESDIEVTVDNGVATLRGSVGSWSEWADAVDNAYEAGALFVEDELEIDPS